MVLFSAIGVVGQQMSQPVNISNTESVSRWAQVAFTPDGIAHIVWEEDYRIVYVSYDGTAFSEPLFLKETTDVWAAFPSIVTGIDGGVFVCWLEGSSYMLRQYDPLAGAWNPSEEVTIDDFEEEPPAVAVDSDGNIYCAWTDYRNGIARTRSKVNGEWGPVTRMNVAGGRGKYTTIASGPDGRIWCVWGEKAGDGNYKIHYSSRTKNSVWTTKAIMNSTAGDQDRPNIAVDPTTNIPHVIYVNIDEVTGRFAGAVIICKIDGLTNPLETAIPAKLQHYPKLTIDRYGVKHVSVEIGPGDFGTGIQYTNNKGGRWKACVGLPNSSGHPKLPGIATDGRNIGLVWASYISDTNKEVYFSSIYPVAVHHIYPPTDLSSAVSFFPATEIKKIKYTFSWKANPDNDESTLKGYNIYSRASSSALYSKVLSVTKDKLSAFLEYTSINKNLSFAVTAVDVNGYESDLKEFMVSFPAAQLPLNMSLSVSAKGVFKNPEIVYQLSWENNPDNPAHFIRAYRIFWKESGGSYVFLSEIPGTSTGATFASTNAGVRKSFGIATVNALGEQSSVADFGSSAGQGSGILQKKIVPENLPVKILRF